jgi:hypothetical protein
MREFSHPFDAVRAAQAGEAVRLTTDEGPVYILPQVITEGDPITISPAPPPGGIVVTLDPEALAVLDEIRYVIRSMRRCEHVDVPPEQFGESIRSSIQLAKQAVGLRHVLDQLPACLACLDTGEVGHGHWCKCPAGKTAISRFLDSRPVTGKP